MKITKTQAAVGAAVIAAAVVAVAPTEDSVSETQELVPRYSAFGELEGFEGRVLLEQVEGALALARITANPIKVRPWMGVGPISDPGAFKVTTWEVALDDGRTVRLQLEGALRMREGETIEEARERFARTGE